MHLQGQENKGLRKLRRTKLKRLLQDKYEVVLSTAYRSGVNQFKTTWTSSTERAALLLDEMATESNKSDYKLDMSQSDKHKNSFLHEVLRMCLNDYIRGHLVAAWCSF